MTAVGGRAIDACKGARAQEPDPDQRCAVAYTRRRRLLSRALPSPRGLLFSPGTPCSHRPRPRPRVQCQSPIHLATHTSAPPPPPLCKTGHSISGTQRVRREAGEKKTSLTRPKSAQHSSAGADRCAPHAASVSPLGPPFFRVLVLTEVTTVLLTPPDGPGPDRGRGSAESSRRRRGPVSRETARRRHLDEHTPRHSHDGVHFLLPLARTISIDHVRS